MKLRPLTPEEIAVFEAIVSQRNKSTKEDYLTYSLALGQKYLRLKGYASKYGIGIPQQIDIIQKLTGDEIIDADWIVVPADCDDYMKEIKCIFKYHADAEWMEENYYIPHKFALPGEENCYKDSIFINISYPQIKIINDNCIAKYSCRLCYDKKNDILVIRCDNGKTYNITRLTSGDRPFEVLKYVIEEADGFATRDTLNNSGNGNIHIGKDSLATVVFDRKSVVRNELSPFVKLTSKSIQVVDVEMTQVQLDGLGNI